MTLTCDSSLFIQWQPKRLLTMNVSTKLSDDTLILLRSMFAELLIYPFQRLGVTLTLASLSFFILCILVSIKVEEIPEDKCKYEIE
jgi:hypothetical protein